MSVVAQGGGPTRTVPLQFFGFNAEDIKTAADTKLWFGPTIPREIADFHASLLRIPGGTTSQWLDWKTGAFVTDPGDPFSNAGRSPLTLGDWARIVRESHTVPVFDLNVVTSTLKDQLGMLRAAARLGMQIRFVELGNELWDPTEPAYQKIYPTGADYGRTMNRWIVQIRRAFPTSEIAVSGVDTSNPFFAHVSRMQSWDGLMLRTVRGENAVTFHPYWTLPNGYSAGAQSSIARSVAAGLGEWARFSSETLATLPKGIQVWLTEWNQTSYLNGGGNQSWIQALTLAAFALKNSEDPRVRMSLVHDVVGQGNNPQHPVPGISQLFPALATNVSGTKVLGRSANGDALAAVFVPSQPAPPSRDSLFEVALWLMVTQGSKALPFAGPAIHLNTS